MSYSITSFVFEELKMGCLEDKKDETIEKNVLKQDNNIDWPVSARHNKQ